MSITTEQAVINKFWPDDDTKTIEDLINVWINDFGSSRKFAISTIKDIDSFSNVSDWSV
jgi:hypothetical protein|tara:strand:+ start:1367 stop:1543 length:177 start_codon:yes stop_codon:yes gene_type:complete